MTPDPRTSQFPPSGLFTIATSQWTEPFWTAARAHRLVAPRCGACGHVRMPPTPFCPCCRSQQLEWVELSGRGYIFSYTVVTKALMPEMEHAVPYVPAVIELPDADRVRLVSNVVGAPLDRIRIGRAVELLWDDISEDLSVPRFRLADDDTDQEG